MSVFHSIATLRRARLWLLLNLPVQVDLETYSDHDVLTALGMFYPGGLEKFLDDYEI